MGWLHLFRKKATRNQENPEADPWNNVDLARMRMDIDQLLGRVGTINIAIQRHDDQLTTHEACLQEHGKVLQTLEQKVTGRTIMPVAPRQGGRPAADNDSCLSTRRTHVGSIQQLDIEQFTEQEKRVLAVFFQNKGRKMSYADVAGILNKSAYTIKNQMNQIRQKADLFDRTTGSQSRNLFALKGDLRVEKYLKVGQPIERPVSIPEPDRSRTKEAEPVVEYVHERPEPQEEC